MDHGIHKENMQNKLSSLKVKISKGHPSNAKHHLDMPLMQHSNHLGRKVDKTQIPLCIRGVHQCALVLKLGI